MSTGEHSEHHMGESSCSKMEREEIQRRVATVEEDRKEAAQELADLLKIGRALGPDTIEGNPDGSITFHHPIDDVFAQMVKTGLIKPKDKP